jgi:ubiquinone/menaquinone biosynthesis C-methylase UbiE
MKIEQHSKAAGAAFWDSNPCGGQWDSYRAFLQWYRRTEPEMFAILDRYDWAGKQVLEVGCGQGSALNYLPSAGASLVGLDMSLQSLYQTRAGASELEHEEAIALSQADAERLPFPDASFDMALSIGVLHHTSDTARGIQEIYRVLKPGGTALVMLYHSGNPKWWATASLRGFSRLVDSVTGRPYTLLRYLQASQEQNSAAGTALLELFGVPILRAFSNRHVRQLFGQFARVHITNVDPGFRRLLDVLPLPGLLAVPMAWLDRRTRHIWGFYQYIEAHKE